MREVVHQTDHIKDGKRLHPCRNVFDALSLPFSAARSAQVCHPKGAGLRLLLDQIDGQQIVQINVLAGDDLSHEFGRNGEKPGPTMNGLSSMGETSGAEQSATLQVTTGC